MKRIILTIILIPIIGICLIVILYICSLIPIRKENNRILNKYVVEFRNIEHPENTRAVAFKSQVRESPGYSSNCFYLVAEIRKFSEDRKNIEAFYASKYLQIGFLENGQFNSDIPYGFDDLSNWKLPEDIFPSNLYIIYTLNPNYGDINTWDFRCR